MKLKLTDKETEIIAKAVEYFSDELKDTLAKTKEQDSSCSRDMKKKVLDEIYILCEIQRKIDDYAYRYWEDIL